MAIRQFFLVKTRSEIFGADPCEKSEIFDADFKISFHNWKNYLNLY